MNATPQDHLRSELERLFELDELKSLASSFLGLAPADVSDADGKGTFARSLVERLDREGSLLALADAMWFAKKGVKEVELGSLPDDLAAGTTIDGYKLAKKLGESGVGITYLAEKDGQRFAFKVLRAACSRDRAAVRRWSVAQRAVSFIDDKNVGRVVANGVLADGRAWVATKLIDGQLLSTRIGRTGPMHINEARPVLRGVALALEALHAKGIAHGNVKMENVFVVRPSEGDPTGILVDAAADRLVLRAAQSSPSLGGLVQVAGTAKAIAPEHARTGRAVPSADVYALGCLLYEVLSGKPPFVGDTAADVIARHLTQSPDAPSTIAPKGWVSKELDALVLRALEKDPASRFASIAAFREAIESFGRTATAEVAAQPLDAAAFDAAKAALLAKPAEDELAASLERLAAPAREWSKLTSALSEAAEKADGTEAKKSLLFRAARVSENDAKDAKAAEAVYQQILALDAEDEIARAALEELKRQTHDHEGLVELLLEKVEKEATPEDRAAVLLEIADTYEHKLEDSDNAFIAYLQALGENPKSDTVVHAVERLARGKAERWNEAVTALNEASQSSESTGDKVAMFTLMGRWYADELGRPDFALPCYQQALALEPASDAALDGTLALYRKAQSYPELAAMLLKRAEIASSPTKKRDFKAEAAELLHKRLNDPTRAADLYEQVLAEDAAHPKASDQLELLYSERGQWDLLVKVLERKARGQHGEARVETLAGLAEIYEDRLDRREDAQREFEAALAESPRHIPSLKGLERLYAKLGRYDALLGNLETQLETVATPRQRIAIWERMGAIQEEQFVDLAKASALFEQITAIEPGHEAANTALARIYRSQQRFSDLATVLEKHALGSSDEERKLGLLLQATRVLMVDVGAPERATEMAERSLALRPNHPEALELLARLKSKSGDRTAAVEAMRKLAESESDKAKRAELYLRAGKMLEEAGDKDGAIAQFKLALDANKDDTAAAQALRAVYASRGDAHGAAELLQREIEATEGSLRKAQLLAELGGVRKDRLRDAKGAREAFKKAIELDPTSTPAARGLGDLAFDDGSFSEAAKFYEPLLARTSEMSAEDALATCLRCGDAFREAKLHDKAQRAYLNAKSLAPKDRMVLERVAETTFESGAADEAAELYRDLLEHAGKDLKGAERGRVVLRMGDALRRSEQVAEAQPLLEEAVELLGASSESIAALRALHAQKGEHEKVVQVLQKRLDVCPDSERADLLIEQGDVLMEKLHDKQRASKSYVAALELRGDDRNLLSKLMAVYSETKDWGKLVEVILRIAEFVSDKAQLAKYYHTAAAITHQELHRTAEAADYYEQALDYAPDHTRSFDGLVAVLTSKSDWARLEKAYRDQIRRADGRAQDVAPLWDALGELLMRRLDKPSDAIDAFEQAQKVDPDNRTRAEHLAELYGKDSKRYFQASVRVHQQLLVGHAYRVESYQALRKLYTDAKKPDASWCACQALTVLKNAEPDEEQFFRKHRTKAPAAVKEPLADELFRSYVQHPDLDPLLTDIFAAIVPAVLATRTQPLASFKLDASAKRDAEKDPADLARTLWYASRATGLALPDVYYQDADPGALGYVLTNPIGLSLGKAARGSGPAQVLAFLAGRHLTFLRGGMLMRALVPTGSGLRAWLLAAIRQNVAQFPVPAELSRQVEEHDRAITQHLAPGARDGLRSLVQRLLAAAPELDMRKWTAAADLTADRVGFVLANDLEATVAIVKASPEDTSSVPQKDRLRELHLYSVSEGYLALRQKLGVAIGD